MYPMVILDSTSGASPHLIIMLLFRASSLPSHHSLSLLLSLPMNHQALESAEATVRSLRTAHVEEKERLRLAHQQLQIVTTTMNERMRMQEESSRADRDEIEKVSLLDQL